MRLTRVFAAGLMLMLVSAWIHAKSIRTAEAVPIGGMQQWISLQGANDTLPVLLFLHGGPGNSVMGYANKFTKDLEQHFVVVHWDQRESGKTAKLNSSPDPLAVSRMERDASELVDYLRMRFHQSKIYLVGHSWGGFLALRVAALHPEWLAACVAAAPMINQWESERQTLSWLVEKAQKENNEEALRELGQVHIPFENPDELYYHRRWLLLANGKNPFPRNYVRRWGVKWFDLYREACGTNLFEVEPVINCPVYFFLGSGDRQAASSITEAYFQAVMAEKKDLIWFTNSGHSLNLTEPKKFQDSIVALLPH